MFSVLVKKHDGKCLMIKMGDDLPSCKMNGAHGKLSTFKPYKSRELARRNYPAASCFRREIYANVVGSVRLTIIPEMGLKEAEFELCFFGHHLFIPWWIEGELYMAVEDAGEGFDLFLYVADDVAGYGAGGSG